MHAQWTEDYVVHFYSLGGSPAPASQVVTNEGTGTVTDPGAITVSGALFEGTVSDPTGFGFGGWYDNPEYSGNAWTFGSDTVSENLKLYARWTVDSTNSAIDVSGQSGANIIAKALNYIKGQTSLSPNTNYTIVLAGGAYTMPGIPINMENPEAVNANIANSNAVITLVGKSATDISLSSNGSLFCITAGELVLGSNITLTGRASNNSSLVTVYGSGASLTMKDGAKITGNKSVYGGGVLAAGGGSFTMDGGEISNNSTSGKDSNGGGVFLYYGSFTMNNGKISNNSSNFGGGVGVEEGSSFTMNDGEISGNTVSSEGGGVVVSKGSFTMSDGTISDNSAGERGGGVSVAGASTFTMSDGEISGNSAADAGGGVHVSTSGNSTFTMSNGKISNNTSGGAGGGVFAGSGAFTMSGGEISNNTAVGGGGVFVYYSAFTMNNGEISDNTAIPGGGGGVIVHEGVFTMNNGEISGNTATTQGGGVAVNEDGTFTMKGGVISGNTASDGGGVLVRGGSFSKAGTGGVIYGNDGAATDNTTDISHGHAVSYGFVNIGFPGYYRDTKLDTTDSISTSDSLPVTIGETLNNWTKWY
jgi:hypothetical protein